MEDVDEHKEQSSTALDDARVLGSRNISDLLVPPHAHSSSFLHLNLVISLLSSAPALAVFLVCSFCSLYGYGLTQLISRMLKWAAFGPYETASS
jgi:hypothetical protein